ncbi:hypothetical protein ACWNT8_13330 [Pigmentibacter ruber]|nr:hypothetical protein GTC16762_13310 [Pigmentibacter ruber]BFD31725.1 hypothetical protein GTC16762_13430 [Pigmentibacter ruber]
MSDFYSRHYYVLKFEGGTLPIAGSFMGKGYEKAVEIAEFEKPISDEKQTSPTKPEVQYMVPPIQITLLGFDTDNIEIYNLFVKAVGGNYDNYTKATLSKVTLLNDAYAAKLTIEIDDVKINGYESQMKSGSFVLHFTQGKFTESKITNTGKHLGNIASYLLRCLDPPEGAAGD